MFEEEFMKAYLFILGVFAFQVVISCIFQITRKGAQSEINVKGMVGTSFSTHRVADGTATISDKLGIVITTILGSFSCVQFLVVSIVIGGILYVLARLFLGT